MARANCTEVESGNRSVRLNKDSTRMATEVILPKSENELFCVFTFGPTSDEPVTDYVLFLLYAQSFFIAVFFYITIHIHIYIYKWLEDTIPGQPSFHLKV